LLWEQGTAAGIPGCRASQLLSNLLHHSLQQLLQQLLLKCSSSSSGSDPFTHAAASSAEDLPSAFIGSSNAAVTAAGAAATTASCQAAGNITSALYKHLQQMQQALQQGRYAVPLVLAAEDHCSCLPPLQPCWQQQPQQQHEQQQQQQQHQQQQYSWQSLVALNRDLWLAVTNCSQDQNSEKYQQGVKGIMNRDAPAVQKAAAAAAGCDVPKTARQIDSFYDKDDCAMLYCQGRSRQSGNMTPCTPKQQQQQQQRIQSNASEPLCFVARTAADGSTSGQGPTEAGLQLPCCRNALEAEQGASPYCPQQQQGGAAMAVQTPDPRAPPPLQNNLQEPLQQQQQQQQWSPNSPQAPQAQQQQQQQQHSPQAPQEQQQHKWTPSEAVATAAYTVGSDLVRCYCKLLPSELLHIQSAVAWECLQQGARHVELCSSRVGQALDRLRKTGSCSTAEEQQHLLLQQQGAAEGQHSKPAAAAAAAAAAAVEVAALKDECVLLAVVRPKLEQQHADDALQLQQRQASSPSAGYKKRAGEQAHPADAPNLKVQVVEMPTAAAAAAAGYLLPKQQRQQQQKERARKAYMDPTISTQQHQHHHHHQQQQQQQQQKERARKATMDPKLSTQQHHHHQQQQRLSSLPQQQCLQYNAHELSTLIQDLLLPSTMHRTVFNANRSGKLREAQQSKPLAPRLLRQYPLLAPLVFSLLQQLNQTQTQTQTLPHAGLSSVCNQQLQGGLSGGTGAQGCAAAIEVVELLYAKRPESCKLLAALRCIRQSEMLPGVEPAALLAAVQQAAAAAGSCSQPGCTSTCGGCITGSKHACHAARHLHKAAADAATAAEGEPGAAAAAIAAAACCGHPDAAASRSPLLVRDAAAASLQLAAVADSAGAVGVPAAAAAAVNDVADLADQEPDVMVIAGLQEASMPADDRQVDAASSADQLLTQQLLQQPELGLLLMKEVPPRKMSLCCNRGPHSGAEKSSPSLAARAGHVHASKAGAGGWQQQRLGPSLTVKPEVIE
jgi:hypothetical protein